MTPMKTALVLACVASMLGMGVAMAQTDPAAPASDAMSAPSGGDATMKKPMMKKHMSKKSMKKKGMMKKM